MSNIIMLDVSSLDCIIKKELSYYIGEEAYSNNYINLLSLLIEERVNIEVSDYRTVYGEFETYGINEGNAKEIVSKLTLPISRALSQLIDYSGKYWYEISFSRPFTVYLEKHTVPEDHSFERAEMNDRVIDFSDDYIPERNRRR